MKKIQNNLSGAWSASPTPLTKKFKIDRTSVRRMVMHHIRLGQKGIFIGGTCGEGPFLPKDDLGLLVQTVVKSNNSKMAVAVQVTDNSYAKVLENIKAIESLGADIAVIAEPWFINCIGQQDDMLKYYMESIEKSKLPVCIYCRGAKQVPVKFYKRILTHPNVCMFKDSSANEQIMQIALSAAKKRNDLTIMTGVELGMVPALKTGYTGILAGGGIVIGHLTNQMIETAKQRDWAKLEKLQKHCDKINYTVYGGKKITSWLTGLKYTLVKMGIFSTTTGYLNYPLSETTKKKIDVMIEKEKDTLFP
ncbi:MAG: dihydrodipicolinate synthase family protein [Sedimentisphaerales bacterium]|nr:dihydrodipicolinate synthase family protein [Sedimentisphaerales bacterium]